MNKSRSGFTIVELLIVIVVIAILAVITVVAYDSVQGKSNDSAVKADLRNNAQKITLYATKNGYMPAFTQLTGDYQLAYTKQSYSATIYCKTRTQVILSSTSQSGKSFYIDVSNNDVLELTTGNAKACATYGISGSSDLPSIATVFNGTTWSTWVK